MELPKLLSIVGVCGFLGVVYTMLFIHWRRTAKKNVAVRFVPGGSPAASSGISPEASADAQKRNEDLQCSKCGARMESGFVLANSGIYWSPGNQKLPWRRMLADCLPNTVNMSFGKRSNQAWKCPQCSFVCIDHSTLLETPPQRRKHENGEIGGSLNTQSEK